MLLRAVLRAVDFLAVRRAGAFFIFRFTTLLAIWFIPLSVAISLEFESRPNKKRMSKFEHFVDIKLQFGRCGKAHSLKPVARNPHFSRVSNAVQHRLHIPPSLVAKTRERN